MARRTLLVRAELPASFASGGNDTARLYRQFQMVQCKPDGSMSKSYGHVALSSSMLRKLKSPRRPDDRHSFRGQEGRHPGDRAS